MRREDVEGWVRRYVRAWNSNDRDDISALFAPDAVYLTGPFDAPWEGRDQIVERWLARKDEPGDTNFTYEVVAVDGDVGVVEGHTDYLSEGYEFANLWLVRLDEDGRCRNFIEYWMQR